jgi:hypothetical protein
MTLEEMTVQRDALLGVRFRGVGTVEMDGRHVTFGTDAETTAAISDIERPGWRARASKHDTR